jgi:hypothetical protein
MWEKLLGVPFALLAVMLVGLTLFLALGAGAYLWDAPRVVVITVACCAAAVAALILLSRRRHPARHVERQEARIHPGITMHAIPVAGGVGLLFALAYVVMFWFGAPGYRPVVLGAAALGGILGALLIWFRRRSRSDRDDTSVLHLDGHAEAARGQSERPHPTKPATGASILK